MEMNSDPVDRATNFVYDQRNIDIANRTSKCFRSECRRRVVYDIDMRSGVVYDPRYEMSFFCR